MFIRLCKHMFYLFFTKSCLYTFSPIMTCQKKNYTQVRYFYYLLLTKYIQILLIFSKVAFLKLKVTYVLPFASRYRGRKGERIARNKVCYGRKGKDISLYVQFLNLETIALTLNSLIQVTCVYTYMNKCMSCVYIYKHTHIPIRNATGVAQQLIIEPGRHTVCVD